MLSFQSRRPLPQKHGFGISSGSLLYTMLVLCILVLPAVFASAQTLRRWREPEKYDAGGQPSIAVLSTGLVVEVHRSPALFGKATIWYHIGKVYQGTIQWGKSRQVPVEVQSPAWPQVVVTPKGQVILTYSDSAISNRSELRYWSGRINPDGDTSQTIDWVRTNIFYDTGFHNSLALAPSYTNGLFAEVHEADGTGKGLYYRVGYLDENLAIRWLTGSNGVKYDTGIDPSIAINSDNQVVEVHQVPGRPYLHYRRGTISAVAPHRVFQDSDRYSDDGERPAVAFFVRNKVVDLHKGTGARFGIGLRWSVGSLAQRDSSIVDWSEPSAISVNDNHFISPSVASNGKVVVSVFEKPTFDELYFSVANIE